MSWDISSASTFWSHVNEDVVINWKNIFFNWNHLGIVEKASKLTTCSINRDATKIQWTWWTYPEVSFHWFAAGINLVGNMDLNHILSKQSAVFQKPCELKFGRGKLKKAQQKYDID